jgi:hypothetical protein
MVVHQDDRRRPLGDRFPEDLARMHEGRGENPARDRHVPFEPMLRVQHRDVKFLDRQILEPWREQPATSRGERTGAPSSRASAASRRPSSSAACTVTARAIPIPAVAVSDATGCIAIRRSDPPAPANSACPTCSAEPPMLPPDQKREQLDRAQRARPERTSRSRGRSDGELSDR